MFVRTRLKLPKRSGLGQWDLILPAITSAISTAGSLVGTYISTQTNKEIANLQIASQERVSTIQTQLAQAQLAAQQSALLQSAGATRIPDPQPTYTVTPTGEIVVVAPVAQTPTTQILPGVSIPTQIAGIPTMYFLIGGGILAAIFLFGGKGVPGEQAES